MNLSIVVSELLFYFLWTLEYVQSESCNFESDTTCGWQSKGWVTTKYAYELSSTGPRRAKEGEYYIRTELNATSRQAILQVPVSSQSCIHFWYHMYGAHIANLTVLTDQGTMWTRAGDQGNTWYCGAAVISQSPNEIRFIAYKGSDAFDIIALDHIQLNWDNPCETTGCNRTGRPSFPPSMSNTGSSTPTATSTIAQTTPPPSWLSGNLELVIAVPCAVLAVCIVVVVVFVCFCRKKPKGQHDFSDLQNQRPGVRSNSYQHDTEGIPSPVYDEPEEYDEIPADYIIPVADDSVDGGYIEPIELEKSADGAVHENGGVSVDSQRQNVAYNSSKKRVSMVDDEGYTTTKVVNSVQNERY